MIVAAREAGQVSLRLDGGIYTEAVLFKCFYWYGNQFEVSIDRADPATYAVTLRPIKGILSSSELDGLIRRISRDLIDFKTRDIVARETQTVRELLVAKAFASTEDLDQRRPRSVEAPSSKPEGI